MLFSLPCLTLIQYATLNKFMHNVWPRCIKQAMTGVTRARTQTFGPSLKIQTLRRRLVAVDVDIRTWRPEESNSIVEELGDAMQRRHLRVYAKQREMVPGWYARRWHLFLEKEHDRRPYNQSSWLTSFGGWNSSSICRGPYSFHFHKW